AEDGIRDPLVTGVQTCALPIWNPRSNFVQATETVCQAASSAETRSGPRQNSNLASQPARCALPARHLANAGADRLLGGRQRGPEIGRASCREGGWVWVGMGGVQ